MKPNITLGADPELFIKDEVSGAYISAHNIVPGDKSNPFEVPRGGIQVDGVAAEFNIKPAKTQREWLRNISNVTGLLERIVKRANKSFSLHAVPYVYFSRVYFDQLPENVRVLGCNPDFNAYTGKANKKPADDQPMRTGAGHIHVGFLDEPLEFEDATEHFETCCDLVRRLDYALYGQSHIWDSDNTRRKLYGEPGCFRPKKYGLEYRVLSNAWLNSIETQAFVYDVTKCVTAQWYKGIPLDTTADPLKSFQKFAEHLRAQNIPTVLDSQYDMKVC